MSVHEETESGHMPDPYDRLLGALDGLPDVVHCKPSTIRTVTPLLGNSSTYIVQTYRQRDQGDTVFLEVVGRAGAVRLAIPPAVTDAIARQRDALTARARSKAARAAAQMRKDRGDVPFQRKKAVE